MVGYAEPSSRTITRQQTMQHADLREMLFCRRAWTEELRVGEWQMQSHGATTVIAIERLL